MDEHPFGEQLPLSPCTPVARHGDPSTSHDAAASVVDLRRNQAAVLSCLRAIGPATDEQLVAAYEARMWRENPPYSVQSPSGIRTRRKELTLAQPPLVVNTGEKRRLQSGRHAIVWRAAQKVEALVA